MYSINGFALDQPTLGWYVVASSTTPLGGSTPDVTLLDEPNRDGRTVLPQFYQAERLTFRMRCAQSSLSALQTLWRQEGAFLEYGTKEAEFQLIGISKPVMTASGKWEIVIIVDLPGVYWRDAADITLASTAIGSAVQDVDVLPGISGRVPDALLFIAGTFGNMELRDSGGSWVRTIVTFNHPGYGLLFDSYRGTARLATVAAPWTPLTDISDEIDVGGGGFKIEPRLIGGDPTTRTGTIRVTTTTQTGVTFRVRAKGAYLEP